MAERSSAKLILNNKELAEEFFEDTRLLGIMSSAKDYQLCWHLNNTMNLDFRINHDIEIQLTRKNRNYYYTVFEYKDPVVALSHYIYNNQFDGEYLLPEFRHLDFIWMMKGDPVADDALQEMAESVRSISGVQLVLELLHEKIKNKEHLVF